MYLAGGLLLTIVVNVPMNEALSAVVVPESVSGAAELWTAYSGPWQRWNLVRTFASGFSLLLALLALMRLGDAHRDVDRIA